MPHTASKFAKSVPWIIVSAVLVWVAVAGRHHWWRASLLTGLAAASFVVGALVGFIFTTYDEESSTIGKIKDWLIGSLATLTLVKFTSLKPILLSFAIRSTSAEFAFALSVAVVFSGLGFFFMFFGRELLFNVPLARKRAERTRIETHQAGIVTIQLLSALPSSILIGIDDVDDLLKSRSAEAEKLKKSLDSPDVQTFIEQSEAAVRDALPLDWDVVSKNAYLQYYRTYFTDSDQKIGQANLALEWILRALVINPDHIDLTIKRADILAILERNRETVLLLEKLHALPECPIFVEQWLGFYLLYLPGREDDSIRHSSSYLIRFPDSNETSRNLACAYARKLCREPKAVSGSLDQDAASYKCAIEHLRRVVHDNPGYCETIRSKWISNNGPFSCFEKDDIFREIVGLTPLKTSNGDAVATSLAT
jgi:tetratricopeptide (TPR) repeat protein